MTKTKSPAQAAPTTYGFGNPLPRRPRASALELYDALIALLTCEVAAREAHDSIPDYTAQWTNADYTADVDNKLWRAMERYEKAVRRSTGAATARKAKA